MEQETRKIDISNRLIALVVILLLAILGFVVVDGFAKLKKDHSREFTVSAQGRAFAKPDIALVQLGVKTEGKEVAEVIKENTKKMNSIIAGLKELGIEEKDLQTTKYSLSPRYDWIEKQGRVFKGYVLEQTLKAKVRDFAKIGQVLEVSANNGANLIGDLSFGIDNPESVYQKAREEAIEKAKEKAKKISEQTGLKLKKIVNVYEGYYYPLPKSKGIGVLEQEMQSAPQIQPGEEEITLKISLVYEVE